MREWLRSWLRKTIEAMPHGAKNHVTWRVVVRRLFSGYAADARKARKPIMTKAQFLMTVQTEFPAAKLSPWRLVDGEWERELDGLRLARLLSERPEARGIPPPFQF